MTDEQAEKIASAILVGLTRISRAMIAMSVMRAADKGVVVSSATIEKIIAGIEWQAKP